MKYFILALISLVCKFDWLHSQSFENIYLVMAYIDDYTRYKHEPSNTINREYKKIIYKIDSDSLLIFDTLNVAKNHAMNNLVQFSDENLIYFEERDMYEGISPRFFSFLDTKDDSIIIKRYDSSMDASFLGYAWYLNTFKCKDLLYIKIEQQPGVLYGDAVNRNFEKKEVELEDFRNVYNEGLTSGFQRGIGYLFHYPLDNYNKLKITTGQKKYEDMPDAPVQIPVELRDTLIKSVGVEINTQNYFVGRGYYRNDSLNINRPTYYWIYDKQMDTWDTLIFSGSEIFNFKICSNWMYGTRSLKDDSASKRKRLGSEEYEKLLNEEVASIRSKYNLENGSTPILFDKTGNIMLYHIPTKTRTIWNTGDKDSEALLIRENKLYYRKYDELRSVNLDIKNFGIIKSSDELIVKEKNVIPFIHHIFFSRSTQKSCKEIWID
jgi:hypothetical protein